MALFLMNSLLLLHPVDSVLIIMIIQKIHFLCRRPMSSLSPDRWAHQSYGCHMSFLIRLGIFVLAMSLNVVYSLWVGSLLGKPIGLGSCY